MDTGTVVEEIKMKPFSEKLLHWLANRNWRFVSSIMIFLVCFEIFELIHKNEPLTDPFHLIELVFFVFILALVGVLINFLIQTNAALQHTMDILDHQHNVSLKLVQLENWEMLTRELVRLPGSVAAVEGSRLFVRNPISGEMEFVNDWNEDGTHPTVFQHECLSFLQVQFESNNLLRSSSLNVGKELGRETQSEEYCLPIHDVNTLFAMIQFKLKPGEALTQNQVEIFENISPEIALALKASQGRKSLIEMRSAETALAERHSVTTYLHDHLSQNLAYLCLKLEQISNEGNQSQTEYRQSDLQHMQAAANESYEILRDMIEKNHPETMPRLINLLSEHGKRVSERANFTVSTKSIGQELPVSPEIQQAVFYVFREALSNIEKHAHAKHVTTVAKWGCDHLHLTISDDGIGFDQLDFDPSKHFGLEIMQERINKIGGRIEICSSSYAGTEISTFVPILLSQEERLR